MKKKLLSVLICLCSALSALSLVACNSSPISEILIDDQPSFVFTATSDVLELNDGTNVENYLNALKNKGEITLNGTNGSYGYYVTEINGYKEETAADGKSGKSWMIYTDLTTLDGVIYSTPDYTVEYNGKKYNQATYSVSSLPCVENYTYILVLLSWNF